MIRTVLGDIEHTALCFCQSHEHLSIRGYPGSLPAEHCIDDEEKSLGELALYRAAGGAALADAQGMGCGRDALMLRALAEKSSVRILASTGFHKTLFYPQGHWIYSIAEDDLTRLYLAELETGMFINCDAAYPRTQCDSRAGFIKAALDTDGFDKACYRKLFTAAARAAEISGAALMVHIEKNSNPVALADFLDRLGVKAKRLIFCHLDRAVADRGIHREICSRSITLEYDTIGRPKYHDDQTEADFVMELLEGGYERRLLLSLDTTRARLRCYGGNPGLTHILERFIPLLRSRGVAEKQISLFFYRNPARLFCNW